MASVGTNDPHPATPSQPASQVGNQRLMSLDALRGFDMFIIAGGKAFLIGAATLLAAKGWFLGSEGVQRLTKELTHPEWTGFTFYDLIFPLFIFLVGVAIPFSLDKRIDQGESRGRLYWRIFRRTVLLVLLGMICTNHLLMWLDFSKHGDLPPLRYVSVLEKIGLAYFFAAMITLHTSARGRAACVALHPARILGGADVRARPRRRAGEFRHAGRHADRLPRSPSNAGPAHSRRSRSGRARFHDSRRGHVPDRGAGRRVAAAVAARRGRQGRGPARRSAGCLVWARVWNLWLPINKNLWTSSFTLWAAGWSLLLLGMFYLVIDVWGWRKWAFFFVVIGANAITIYALREFGVDFNALGRLIFGRAPLHKDLLLPTAVLAVEWIFLYVLYRNRLFLRL